MPMRAQGSAAWFGWLSFIGPRLRATGLPGHGIGALICLPGGRRGQALGAGAGGLGRRLQRWAGDTVAPGSGSPRLMAKSGQSISHKPQLVQRSGRARNGYPHSSVARASRGQNEEQLPQRLHQEG